MEDIYDPRTKFKPEDLRVMARFSEFIQVFRKVDFKSSLQYAEHLYEGQAVPDHVLQAWELVYKQVALERYIWQNQRKH